MKTDNVFLYIPNLIGYGRIVFGILSFYYMPFDAVKTLIFYFLSGILDAVDGHAARLLNQSSRFGAMLDQLTDRCATLGLFMVLGYFYPTWMLFFQLLAVIDVSSHWLHLHSCDLVGAGTHKQSTNPILQLYYTSRPFLFFMCLGNEAFLCFLYLCHFSLGPPLPLVSAVGLFQIAAGLCFPIAMAKNAISLVHLVTAAQTVAGVDHKEKKTNE